ncbi:MAG: DUF4230 domain-containing protein [Lentisphaeria bacterium]|jgi:hypothetical protein|nr:DUF4230 domain-containing protein [Lentisphaeria bacterium]
MTLSLSGLRRTAIRAVALALAFLLVAAAVRFRTAGTAAPAIPRSAEARALDILRREELRFLVTDRVAAQVVAEASENSPVLGRREGYLVARAAMHYGVDLAKLTEGDVAREGGAVVVTIPEPEELDFAVDLDSLRYLARRSGLQVAADWALARDQEAELRSILGRAARDHMRAEGLLPTREDIVARLNAAAEAIGRSLDARLVFR